MGTTALWLDLVALLAAAVVGGAFALLWHYAIFLIVLALLGHAWLLWHHQRSSGSGPWSRPEVLVWATVPRVVFFSVWGAVAGVALIGLLAAPPLLNLVVRLRSFNARVAGTMVAAVALGWLGIAGLRLVG